MFTRVSAMAVVGVLALTSCQRPDDDTTRSTLGTVAVGDTSASDDDVAPSSTVVAPTTTAPDLGDTTAPTTAPTSTPTTTPSTAPASTTPTTAPPPTTQPEPTSAADLVLLFDGVAPFLFGQPDADVVTGLSGLLGEPVSDEPHEYPTSDDGVFLNDDASQAFVFPFGRTVCFANGLCTEFGAGADSALLFTGWDFTGADAAGLATEDGITVGSLWADHLDAIEVFEGGCFQEGYGSASGVDIVLLSSGEPFLAIDDEGNQTPQTPPATDVVVTAMRAGELPFSPEADC